MTLNTVQSTWKNVQLRCFGLVWTGLEELTTKSINSKAGIQINNVRWHPRARAPQNGHCESLTLSPVHRLHVAVMNNSLRAGAGPWEIVPWKPEMGPAL